MAKTKTIDLVDINANSIFTPVDVMGNFNKLKVGINDVNTEILNIKKDIGGYADRLKNANEQIESML